MKCDVQVVEDAELPQGLERVIIERASGSRLLLIARSAAANWLMVRALESDQREPARVFELRAVG